jgi:hypothetical protein
VNWPYERIALHAQTLALVHPITNEYLRFDSQLPSEMVGFVLGESREESRASRAR